jgi:hypothetical protein
MTLCECGCGEIVTPGSRFKPGHNRRCKYIPQRVCESTDKAITIKAGEKILSMSKDDALNYIKEPSNRKEIGTIFNTFIKVME